MIKAFGLIMMIFSCSSFAMRDIFNLSPTMFIGDVAIATLASNLNYVGSIISEKESVAFLEDAAGSVYRARKGDSIGEFNNKIINILQDGVIMSDGKHFAVIK